MSFLFIDGERAVWHMGLITSTVTNELHIQGTYSHVFLILSLMSLTFNQSLFY